MTAIRKLIIATAAAVAVLALTAGSAMACSYSGPEQVFRPWGDLNYYVLAPDGGFESGGTGWDLNGGAGVVRGNESFYLNDAGDRRSLALPDGSSAVSPAICMAIDTPSFRLVARNSGDPSSELRVEAVHELLGLLNTKVVGNVKAGSAWVPTESVSTVLTLSTVVGTVTPSSIEIRIRPRDTRGEWRIDDLYIDPFARH